MMLHQDPLGPQTGTGPVFLDVLLESSLRTAASHRDRENTTHVHVEGGGLPGLREEIKTGEYEIISSVLHQLQGC